MLEERFPYLEAECLWNLDALGFKGKMLDVTMRSWDWIANFDIKKPASWTGYKNMVDKLEHQDKNERRFIKSHLPFNFLPNSLGAQHKFSILNGYY